MGLIAAVTALLITIIVSSPYVSLAETREDVLKIARSDFAHQSTALAEQVGGSFKSLDLVLSSIGDYIARRGSAPRVA